MTSSVVVFSLNNDSWIVLLKPRRMRNFSSSETTDDPPLVAEWYSNSSPRAQSGVTVQRSLYSCYRIPHSLSSPLEGHLSKGVHLLCPPQRSRPISSSSEIICSQFCLPSLLTLIHASLELWIGDLSRWARRHHSQPRLNSSISHWVKSWVWGTHFTDGLGNSKRNGNIILANKTWL